MALLSPCVARFTVVAVAIAIASASSSAFADEAPTFADRAERADGGVDEATRSVALLIHPLAMWGGVFGAEADVALTKRIALAIEGDVYRFGGGQPDAALGVGLSLYPLRSIFQGLYIEPRFVVARPLGESPLKVDWSTDVLGLGGTAGWQWTWDYGLSVQLGAGAIDYIGGPGSVPPGSLAIAGADVVLVMDASVGWAF